MDREPGPPAKPLVFQLVTTEDDVMPLMRYVGRLKADSRLGWSVVPFVVALTSLPVGAMLLGLWMGVGMPWYVQVYIAFSAPLCAYTLLGWRTWFAWLFRLSLRRHLASLPKSQVTLTADRVALVNDMRWSLVERVAATPAGLLFSNEAGMPLFWLPNRVLEVDHLRAEVLELAEANGVRVQYIE